LRVNRRRRGRRPSNLVARRRHRPNPVGGGVLTEAFNYSIASFAVAVAAPAVNRLVGGFLPLGQFQQPVIFAATGFGLGWLAGVTPITRRFQRPLVIVGVALGITTIITPWIRKLLSGVGISADAGMSGYRRRMSGIAAVTGTPPNIMSLPPAAPPNGNAMRGISAIRTGY